MVKPRVVQELPYFYIVGEGRGGEGRGGWRHFVSYVVSYSLLINNQMSRSNKQ